MKCLRLAAGTFSWLTISVTEISSMSSISDDNRSIPPMDSMAPSHKSRWAKQRAKIKAGKTAEKLKTHAHVNLIDYLEAHNIRTPEYVGPYKGLLLSSGSHFRKYTLQQCKFAQGSCQSRMAQSFYEGSALSSHKERSLSCVFRGEHLCLKRYRARHPYPRLGK